MQIVHDYQCLHQIPELDHDLPKTLSYIRSRLAPLKCVVFSPIPSAVCAYFYYERQRTLAFRADTDALPIQEQSELPWKSKHPGRMHACGHDGHTAILLDLARKLHREKQMPYNVLLIFQPAEETTGGAQAICKTGILHKLAVQYIFALHLWPELEKGEIFGKSGILMSHSSAVTVTFTGVSKHIADTCGNTDVFGACCRFYSSVGQLGSDRFLLKFGKINGGTAENILCSQVRLSGTLRTFDTDTVGQISSTLTTLCYRVAKQYSCQGEISIVPGYPSIQNDNVLWEKVQKIHPVKSIDRAYWTAEDFSYYQENIPGIYFLLGIGNTPPLHSPFFTFDTSVLEIGTDFFWKLCKTM